MTRLFSRPGVAAGATALGMTLAAGGGYALAGSSRTIKACIQQRGAHAFYSGRCKKGDRKVTWNRAGIPGPRGAQGSQGSQGPPGSPGVPGTAKAYGLVNAAGSFDATKSHNVAGVTHPFTGAYCVTVTGASSASEGATATPNITDDNTAVSPSVGRITHVEYASDGSGTCAPGQFTFETFQVSGSNVSRQDEGFSFIVP